MNRKYAASISALLAGFMLLSGCSKDAEKQAAIDNFSEPLYEWGGITGKTLTVWGEASDLSRSYMTRVFDNYEAATGNTIVKVGLSKEDINVKVPDAFNRNGIEKPDLLLGYGGTNLENLRPTENFYDFTNAPWVDDLTDTALTQSVYDAKVMGLPHGENSISGTLYNKAVFKKNGIKIPTTQDEFLSACEKLLEKGITPMYLPYAEITMLLYQFPLDSIVQNRDILDGLNSGELSYADIPEMRKIIDWYKTMSDRGYFGEDYTANNWDGMDDAMKSGKYAMMLCWDTWIYTNFTGNTKNIGLMPAFIGTPEEGSFEGPNVLLTMVNKNSKQLDAALDLVSYMADPCNYNVSFEGIYTAPMFKNQVGSITTPQYLETERLIDKLFYNSTAWLRIRGFSQIDATYIQQYMQGKCSAQECLEGMDAARTERAGINP